MKNSVERQVSPRLLLLQVVRQRVVSDQQKLKQTPAECKTAHCRPLKIKHLIIDVDASCIEIEKLVYFDAS